MLYVITRSAAEGRAAGLVSALGIATGCVVHTVLVALGLAGLLAAVPAALAAVRYAGAAYLLYLGLQRLFAPAVSGASTMRPAAGLGAVYRQGVLTNVLNPKVALFFLAFLPQFAVPGETPVALQLALLGTAFNVSGTIVNLLVAIAASGTAALVRRPRSSGAANWVRRASGLVFLALGVRLAFQR